MSYTSVSVSDELHAEIKHFVAFRQLGYSSIAEFVKDAVRRRMEEIRQLTADCALCRKSIALVDGHDDEYGVLCTECKEKLALQEQPEVPA